MTCSAVRCVGTVNLSERLPRSVDRKRANHCGHRRGASCPRSPVGPSARPRFVYRCATLRGSFVRSSEGHRRPTTPLVRLCRRLHGMPCCRRYHAARRDGACHGSESLRRLTSSANSALPLRRRAKLQPQAYRALT
jgi:hypothetical protein